VKITDDQYLIGAIVTVVAINSLASAAIVKFGHSFSILANTGALHAGVIGSVQTVAGTALTFLFTNAGDNRLIYCLKTVTAHTIVGATVFAVSLLAFKMGLTSSALTITGTAILALANMGLTLGLASGGKVLFDALVERGIIERTS
jgi:hypothetical protein